MGRWPKSPGSGSRRVDEPSSGIATLRNSQSGVGEAAAVCGTLHGLRSPAAGAARSMPGRLPPRKATSLRGESGCDGLGLGLRVVECVLAGGFVEGASGTTPQSHPSCGASRRTHRGTARPRAGASGRSELAGCPGRETVTSRKYSAGLRRNTPEFGALKPLGRSRPTPGATRGLREPAATTTVELQPLPLGGPDRIQQVARNYVDRGVRFLQINANDSRRQPQGHRRYRRSLRRSAASRRPAVRAGPPAR